MTKPLSLGPSPVVDLLLLFRREPSSGVQHHIAPGWHLSGANHRCHPGQHAYPALIIHGHPLRQIQVASTAANVPLHHPRSRCQMCVDRIMRPVRMAVAAFRGQELAYAFRSLAAAEQRLVGMCARTGVSTWVNGRKRDRCSEQASRRKQKSLRPHSKDDWCASLLAPDNVASTTASSCSCATKFA